jgi:hypothetical protein
VWPQLTDDVGFAERVNAMPKYVTVRFDGDPASRKKMSMSSTVIRRWATGAN